MVFSLTIAGYVPFCEVTEPPVTVNVPWLKMAELETPAFTAAPATVNLPESPTRTASPPSPTISPPPTVSFTVTA